MTNFEELIINTPLGKTWLFYAGQAGFIIKSKSGKIMAVDVYFSECGERIEGHIGFKRLLPKLLDPSELKYDYVVATHPHFDHFDFDAMPELLSNSSTTLVASIDCEKEVKKLGITNKNTFYKKPGDRLELGDYLLEFTECDHGTGAPDAYGLVIIIDGKKIYIAGDTCLRMDRVDYINSFGPFDIVIGPINGAYGNMNEEDFAEFSSSLNTNIIIPCHYGCFASHGGNPGKFMNIMNEKHSRKNILLMAMGERIEL